MTSATNEAINARQRLTRLPVRVTLNAQSYLLGVGQQAGLSLCAIRTQVIYGLQKAFLKLVS